jgi:hypothetical protein
VHVRGRGLGNDHFELALASSGLEELLHGATLAVGHDHFVGVDVIERLVRNVLVERAELFDQLVDALQDVRLEIACAPSALTTQQRRTVGDGEVQCLALALFEHLEQ